MAGYGEIYAEVDARAVNDGIATLAGSGEIGEEGDAGTVVVWLHWSYGENYAGFTGKSWYWDDPLNPLKTQWNLNGPDGYQKDEEGFNSWLRATNPTELDTYLGTWDSTDKAQFCTNHTSELGVGSVGCIEYRGY